MRWLYLKLRNQTETEIPVGRLAHKDLEFVREWLGKRFSEGVVHVVVNGVVVLRDGSLVDDFLLGGSERVLHVINAPSPAATSSLAIGRVLAAEAIERFGL